MANIFHGKRLRKLGFHFLIVTIVPVFFIDGCKARKKPDSSKIVEMTENSRRRAPTAAELKGVLAVKGGCTAFAIKNAAKRAIVATAAHCLNDYDPETWCGQGGLMWPAKPGAGGVLAEPKDDASKTKCKAVLAHDPKLDFILLEMEKSLVEQRFELGNFYPAQSTRMTAIGFPVDSLASASIGYGNPVLTENCWILDGKGKFSSFAGRPTNDVVVNHNCTIYGGNSGGPMIIEGTNIAIGMPGDYIPDDYKNKPWDQVNSEVDLALALLIAIPDATKSELRLSIIDNQPSVARNVSYLTVSSCKADTTGYFGPPAGKAEMEWIVPIYNSMAGVAAIDIKFVGDTHKVRYTCASDDTCIADDGTVVKLSSPKKIIFHFDGSLKSEYTCTQY